METTLYIIRHAQASGNLDKVFQGRFDGKITTLGYQQLEALADKCKEFSFDIIYSSPLSRALETAQYANKYYNFDIVLDEGLLEINGGDWEGKKWASFDQTDPDMYDKWKNSPWDYQAPNGESMIQVYSRLAGTVDRIVSENKGKTICVVSHGCAIRNLITYLMGLEVTKLPEAGWCDNTGVSKIIFDENLTPSVVFKNNIEHLPDSLRTYVTNMWNDKK